MNTARLAVLGAATMLAFSGFAHAAAGPPRLLLVVPDEGER